MVTLKEGQTVMYCSSYSLSLIQKAKYFNILSGYKIKCNQPELGLCWNLPGNGLQYSVVPVGYIMNKTEG